MRKKHPEEFQVSLIIFILKRCGHEYACSKEAWLVLLTI
jgi:hypothetical protein